MTTGLIEANTLIHAFETGPEAEVALVLLAEGHAVSVQGLSEFVRNARRKLRMIGAEASDARDQIVHLCGRVVPVDLDVHRMAVRLTDRYQLNIFDGLMLAAALKAGCDVFWSEEYHHGLTLDGRLRIVNPFSAD